MMNMIKRTQEKEDVFEVHAVKFLSHHPYIGFFLIVIGMPIFILSILAVCAVVIMFFASCFSG
ncbi:MAG: hypothetical protein ACI39Q_09775 [Wujia sp.]